MDICQECGEERDCGIGLSEYGHYKAKGHAFVAGPELSYIEICRRGLNTVLPPETVIHAYLKAKGRL